MHNMNDQATAYIQYKLVCKEIGSSILLQYF